MGGYNMTYEESYRQSKTVEELKSEVLNDIATAILINTDRIPIILESANKVANEKFKLVDLKIK